MLDGAVDLGFRDKWPKSLSDILMLHFRWFSPNEHEKFMHEYHFNNMVFKGFVKNFWIHDTDEVHDSTVIALSFPTETDLDREIDLGSIEISAFFVHLDLKC